MTKFIEQENKEIILPESKAKVLIKANLTFGDTLSVADFDEGEAQLNLVKKMVLEWDFVDNEEKPIPITVEFIKKLSTNDGNFLVREITGNISDDKKKD